MLADDCSGGEQVVRGRGRLLTALASRIHALVLIALAVWYLSQASQLLLWRGVIPGPGFTPTVVGITLLLLAILLLRHPLPHGISILGSMASGSRRVPMELLVVAVLTAYILLLPAVGYILATVGLLLVLLRAYSNGSWFVDLAISIGVSVLIYVVFKLLLAVNLPGGSLFGF